MAGLPPWSPPTDYCSTMIGVVFSSSPSGWTDKLFGVPANYTPPIYSGFGDPPSVPLYQSSTFSWTSDNVFCMQAAANFWQICLFLALAFWGFFTVVQLFGIFHVHLHAGQGQALAQVMRHLLRQFVILILAICSFYLLLLLHQVVFLVADALMGGHLAQWRLDSIWVQGVVSLKDTTQVGGGAMYILNAAQNAVNQGDPTSQAINYVCGGCTPGQNTVFGTTFSTIWSSIGPLEATMIEGWPPLAFVVTFLLTCAAPLAIVFSAFEHSKKLFDLWLKSTLELLGLALISAAAIGGFSHLLCGGSLCAPTVVDLPSTGDISTAHNINGIVTTNPFGLGDSQYAWLLLGFGALVCGLQITYMWRLIGSIVSMGSSMYQSEYNRDVGMFKAIANAFGMLGTAAGFLSFIPGIGLAGDVIGAAGNMVSNTAQGAMSMIPQSNGSTMAPLPAYTERGIVNSRASESAVDTNSGEAVTSAELEEAREKFQLKKQQWAASQVKPGQFGPVLPRPYETYFGARWRGGMTFGTTATVTLGSGKQVQYIQERVIGRMDIPDPLTMQQYAVAFARGNEIGRRVGWRPAPDGTPVIAGNSPPPIIIFGGQNAPGQNPMQSPTTVNPVAPGQLNPGP